jgi:hypothetical protein
MKTNGFNLKTSDRSKKSKMETSAATQEQYQFPDTTFDPP